MQLIKSVVAKWEKKCTKIPFLFKLYSWPYKGILEKEIELANISSEDKVLNIGCGAMPFTAVYLAQLTGAEVWAVDRDQEVIERAKSCVRSLGLEDQIKVVEGDGADFTPGFFTAALVALQAEPKTEILENLLDHSKDGARFVFRAARASFASQYDQLATKYKPNRQVKQKMITFDKSVLFIK